MIEIVSVCDFPEPRGSERVFGVDEDDFAAGISGGFVRHLSRDAESVRQLRLAGPEFAERLRDRHALDPPADQLVKLATSGRDVITGLTALVHLYNQRLGNSVF